MTTQGEGIFDDLIDPVALEQAAKATRQRLYADEHEEKRKATANSRRQASVLDEVLRRALAACEPGVVSPGRNRDCVECTRLHELEPIRPVAQVETWVRDGQRFHGALCVDCADMAWSKRFKAAVEKAKSKGEIGVLRSLDERKAIRISQGRRVYA